MKLAKIPEDDIHESIRLYSPNIEEFGCKPDNYVQFVKTSAEQQIKEELKKLAEYHIIPSVHADEDLVGEYQYQRQRLMDYINISCERAIDEKIAVAMLDQGKEEQAIARAIDNNTNMMPLSGSSYGNEILKAAKQNACSVNEAKNMTVPISGPEREVPQRVRTKLWGDDKEDNKEETTDKE